FFPHLLEDLGHGGVRFAGGKYLQHGHALGGEAEAPLFEPGEHLLQALLAVCGSMLAFHGHFLPCDGGHCQERFFLKYNYFLLPCQENHMFKVTWMILRRVCAYCFCEYRAYYS